MSFKISKLWLVLSIVVGLLLSPKTYADRDDRESRNPRPPHQNPAPEMGPQVAPPAQPAPKPSIASKVMGVPVTKRSDFETGFQQATETLTQIQKLIDEKKYNEALAHARTTLLDVKRRTGIEPKTPAVIETNILNNQDLKTPFKDLSTKKRFELSKVVKAEKDGFYLDLLNLAKRAELLYLRAEYLQKKEKNNLKERDIEHIKNELLGIDSISIFFNSGLDDYYLAFDWDLADTIIQYEFNRELLDLVSEVEELKLTEDGFKKLLEEFREKKLQEHWSTIKVPKPTYYVPFFSKNDFKANGIEENDKEYLVTVNNPTYRGMPIAISSMSEIFPDFSGKLDARCDSWGNWSNIGEDAFHMPFPLVICHALGFPSVGTKPDGSFFEESEVAQAATVQMSVTFGVSLNNDKGVRSNFYVTENSEVTSSKVVTKLYCSK